MKKMSIILLAMVLIFALTACSVENEQNEDLVITRATEPEVTEAANPEQEEAADVESGVFSFVADGVELIPGTPFDATVLGEASSVYEVPSCAIEGTDNVYNYETFEITAYDDGTGEVVYSIYLLDSNLTTTEGLALGDDAARVIELYGENYTEVGTAYVYTRSNTQLLLIMQNGVVVSIEYRMAG
jgi:hypothetical protein